jgi:arylsulfatase A-like enzyme
VPRDASLRFAIGVVPPAAADRRADARGVAFTVRVDGREAFHRVLDPVAEKTDRGWIEAEIDLGPEAGRTVDVDLATAAAGPVAAGTPGWSHVRLVQRVAVARQAAASDRPNVIVLVVDTLRADRVGVYGATPSPTPQLDRLAATGLVFEQALAQSSWTMPSVASMMTGLQPRSHGVWGGARDGDGTAAGADGFLPDALTTLAEHVARAGVTTVGVSANPLVSRGTNLAQGFETFVDYGMEKRFGHGDRRRDWAPASAVYDTFLDWLDEHRDRRFFAYLQTMEPHDPYAPPAPPPAPAGIRPAIARGDVYELANRRNFRGGAALTDAEIAWLRTLYDGEVRAWDAALPRLLDGLARAGVAESTVVLVTADHGEAFQEHGKLRHGVDLYDETVRVPFIVAGPGVRPGRRPDQAEGIDLFPTVATLLGAAPPTALPGRDLLAAPAPRPGVAELGADFAAARTPDAKTIRQGGRVEVYDLARDPGEQRDLGPTAPAALAAALAALADAPPPPPADGRDPALAEKLRALGYVQ